MLKVVMFLSKHQCTLRYPVTSGGPISLLHLRSEPATKWCSLKEDFMKNRVKKTHEK